jgi:DNA helicase II / ATP-dependent DNA helicase PcrA
VNSLPFHGCGRAAAKSKWSTQPYAIIREIAEVVAETALAGPEVDEFLAWPQGPDAAVSEACHRVQDNIYRFSKHGREVAIQVGSIHSVKGRTNTSTLVLETYWYDHNMQSIKAWLTDEARGGQGQKDRVQSRLKLQYVAMTRPTHLLCLAIKHSTFEKEDGSLDKGVVHGLEERGWHIRCV